MDLDRPDPILKTHTDPHMITVGVGRGKAYSARQTVLSAVTAAGNGASSDLLGPVVTQEVRDRLASGEPLHAVTEDLWRRLTTILEMTLQTADLNGSSHGH